MAKKGERARDQSDISRAAEVPNDQDGEPGFETVEQEREQREVLAPGAQHVGCADTV